jgi:hypothetical protein
MLHSFLSFFLWLTHCCMKTRLRKAWRNRKSQNGLTRRLTQHWGGPVGVIDNPLDLVYDVFATLALD